MQLARPYQIGGYKDFVLICAYKPNPRADLDFEVIENPAESVKYDPSQSHIVAFAINYQSDEKFKARTLGISVVNDARLISHSFEQFGLVPLNNITVHEARQHFNDCTFEGMKRHFIQTAKSVGNEGLFVFHFSGHGIRVVQTDQWGLAPSDFDYSDRTYVTANVLKGWLNEAGCKAKHVLFTLDCCYAGGISDTLAQFTEMPHRSVFVVSSCTAEETSYSIGTLGNSVFSYFLAYAMRKHAAKGAGETPQLPPSIALQTVFSECFLCSEALSSLLVKYDGGSLHPAMIHPGIQTLAAPIMEPFEETDSGRFEYIFRWYDQQKPIERLHAETDKWLGGHRNPEGPLSKLQSRKLLERKEVVHTALCSMMYSVCAYQLRYQPTTVACVNTYVTAYMNVISVIEFHCGNVDFTLFHFQLALGYYVEVLKKSSIPYIPLRDLYAKICSENNLPNDETDGTQNTVSDIPPIAKWEPL